jgi:hypothetical protein
MLRLHLRIRLEAKDDYAVGPMNALRKRVGELRNLREPFSARNGISYHGVTECPPTRSREAVDTYS